MAEALLTLGALVVVAALAHLAARAVRAPAVPFFIAAGLLARPLVPPAPGLLEFILFLSLAFLLFAAGVSLHPARFRTATLGPILAVGAGATLVLVVPAAAVGVLAGWSVAALPYAAAAVALSSTLVVLSVLAARGEVADAHGRLLVGALLIQDALALLLFAIVPNLPDAPVTALVQTAGTLGLAGLAYLATRVARRPGFWAIVRDAESRVLLAFGLVFAFMLLAGGLGVPVTAGAFLAGLAVSPFPSNVHLRPTIRVAREFFTPLFFVILGAFFPLPGPDALPAMAGLAALIILVKPMVIGLVARAAGFTRRASAEAGALAGQGSEFALILAVAGTLTGHLTNAEFGIIGFTVALTMLVTPFITPALVVMVHAVLPRERPPPPAPRAGHVVVLGAGTTARSLLPALRESGEELVAVDVDPHALGQLPADVPRLQGDATSRAVLEAAHVQTARAVVCFIRGERPTREALQLVTGLGSDRERLVFARAETPASAEILADLGAIPLEGPALTADALTDTLHRMDAGTTA